MRKLDKLTGHKFELEETRPNSELILTQLINIAEMKHKFAGEIYSFILKAIHRLPTGSPILEKIIGKATSAHISPTDEFPYHLVDFGLETARADLLVRAAEANDDLFTYVFAKLGDDANAAENASEAIATLFQKLPVGKILKNLPRVQYFVPQLM